jgi:RimJ/RimL family protein N-acetyltransferase
MPLPIATLQGSRLILREVVPGDRESYLSNAGQAEANWGFGGGKDRVGPKTQEQADRWLKGRTGWMRWLMTVDGRPIGTVSLHDIVESDRRATLAIGIWNSTDMDRGLVLRQ